MYTIGMWNSHEKETEQENCLIESVEINESQRKEKIVSK